MRTLITEAYRDSPEFGLFVEVADATGARESQIARLNVEDLQADLADPRLMMPCSKKGKKGHTKLSHHPVPILVDVAKRLQALAAGRAPNAPLLTKPGGGRWRKSHHSRRFDLNKQNRPQKRTLSTRRPANASALSWYTRQSTSARLTISARKQPTPE